LLPLPHAAAELGVTDLCVRGLDHARVRVCRGRS
jgi:hypothetical protein